MKTIGKLLWHKAVRDYSVYHPNGLGEIIIKVPAIFEYKQGVTMDYSDIKRRIILAVANHLFKKDPCAPNVLGNKKDAASAEVTVTWNSPTEAEAIITIKTQHLDVWQWICNQGFAAVNTTRTVYS